MKIVQICYSYPPSFSGYGKQLNTLNKGLSKLVNVTVLTAFNKGGNSSTAKCTILSIFNRQRPILGEDRKYYYLFCFLFPILFINKLLRADVIHVVKAGPEAAIAVVIGRLLAKPVIIKIAQDEIDYNLKKVSVTRRIRLKLVSKASAFVALSEKIYVDLIDVGVSPKSISKIPNAVDISSAVVPMDRDELRRTLQKSKISQHEFVYVYVGSISKRKGIWDLLEAMSRLPVSAIEKRLILIGPDYQDVESWKDYVVALNSRDDFAVDYLGWVENPLPYIAVADVLVLPSYSEGMPNVVLEALCVGTPVVMSNIPVSEELISNENGLTYPVGNLSSLTNKLQSIQTVYYDRKVIRDRAILKYSVDRVARQYLELYCKCTGGV